jgi:LAS superfamily LD-carboxypeptidase LdcB
MRVALIALACAALAGRADARTATGYKNGEKLQLRIVDCGGGGVECEAHTAAAFRAMAKAAHKAGLDLSIRSGFRSHAKQTALYKKYRSGNGNLAAPPGFSNHESGRALDLYITKDKVYSWLKDNAGHYGFYRTVPGEAWHWEYLGGGDREQRVVARRAARG